MVRLFLCSLSMVLLLTFVGPAPRVVADDIPDEIEKQIDEQTEKLPDEVREKVREQIKEQVAKKIAEMRAKGEPIPGEDDEPNEAGDDEADESEESAEGDDSEAKAEEKKEESDPLSEEAKKMKTEMDLNETRFKYKVAQYEQQLAEQRLAIEKSKIDRKLESERIAEQMTNMQRELERVKLEVELAKKQTELDEAKLAAEIATKNAEKQRLEVAMAVEDVVEKTENRILGDESYPDEPFKDGVLNISLRRIELNGPIMSGAADYVCQRLDYFNNHSKKPIFLVIDNCPGGSAIEGMQIVQAIERSDAPVHVVVKRFAASMAAIITTLADHSYCYPDAIILHHQASSVLVGNGRDMEDQRRQFEEVSTRLIGAVAEKIGTTEKEFVDAMYENRVSGDWELFGDKAVENKWVGNIATCIREQGIRTKPTGQRGTASIFSIGGSQSESATPEANGYLERYEVVLPEQVDDRGQRFQRLPRLAPVDAWLLFNPDGYYRY